jgi:tripartite-type tricarboxylate transporter receptor subunit TctC
MGPRHSGRQNQVGVSLSSVKALHNPRSAYDRPIEIEGAIVTKFPRRQFLHLSAGAAALPALSRVARAQAYPSRPITMVVGAAAGGPTDTIGRIIIERMRASLGQTIIIENNGSAAGSVAHGRVARAAPDGYTVSLGHWGTHVVNGAVYSLPYNLLDLEPVSLISSNSFLFTAKRTLPVDDLRGLVAWLKANPDKATEGTSGAGSPEHVGGILLQAITGTRWQFVPYRGGNPKMQDLVAGQFDWTFSSPGPALPLLRQGSIKAYAVAAQTRLSVAPDIPTTDEAGLPGFYLSYWHGLWAPRATPEEVVAKLNAAVVNALADPGVRQRLAELGQDIFASDQQTPRAFGAFHKAEIEKWWPIIKAAGIKAE